MAQEQPESDVPKHYFAQAVYYLYIAGIPINEIQPPFKCLYFFYTFLLLFTFIYSLMAAELIHIFDSFREDDLLFTVSYLVGHVMGCAKVTVLLLKRKTVRGLLHFLESERFLPQTKRGGPQEVQLIKDAVAKNKFQIRAWWFIVLIMLSNRIIWVALNPTIEVTSPDNPNVTVILKQLPYSTSYLISFDMQKSPYYELVFIHQTVGIWIFGWYMGSFDTITNGLMIHVTAQFKIVANAFLITAEKAKEFNNQLYTAQQGSYTKRLQGQFTENFKKWIKSCIQHHQDALTLANGLEDTFNLALLAQFLVCLCLYGIQLYQLSQLTPGSAEFISMAFFFFAMCLQLSVFCWNGNELSIASEAVAEAAYSCDWISTDTEAKQMLRMVIMRAQKPVYMTAGKFSKLSMVTFAAILRGSLSYYTVLNNVNDKET